MQAKSALRSEVAARNRRQRTRAHELRERAGRNRHIMQLSAQRKIQRSREKIRKQAQRSARRAKQARAKAEGAGGRV